MGIADALYAALGGDAAIHITAFDGSAAGPEDAGAGLVLRSPLALRHLITGRGSLGLARAFVAGDLELTGGAYASLRALTENATELSNKARLSVIRAAVRAGGISILRPAAPPAEEIRLRGGRHSL